MSSIIFPESYVAEAGRRRDGAHKKRKIYFWFTAVFVAAVASQVAFQVFIAPEITISRIQVYCSDSFQLSNEEIIALAGIGGREYYFSVNTAGIEEKLSAHPLIKSAEVEKIFPSMLNIHITERKPLVHVLVNRNGRTVPAVLDNEGVVFQIGRTAVDHQMPVVSGIRFMDLKPGIRLPGELAPYLSSLEKIRKSEPALFSQISELKFVRKYNNDYDVILYPAHGSIRVRTGSMMNDSLLRQIFVVLDIIEKNGLKSEMEEIDFRSGRAVYRVKEG